jgi:formylglycine-generating enzyme required for sulfatase activity
MPKIFISYRRADSQDTTDRIHDYMVAHFGDDSVFQDVDSIPFGVDFRQHLSNEINQCDVVLVIIGADWARLMQERAREVNDFVRVEVESALKLNKLVIPVLVRGAQMPAPDDLPENVQALCWLNAAKVRPNPDFRHDCQTLAKGIQQVIASRVSSPPPVPVQTPEKPSTSHSVREVLAPPAEIAKPKPSLVAPPKPAAIKSRVREIMPSPFEWIAIPGGKVFLEAGGYVPEGGAEYTVDDFYIAKYPITNAQFQVFVDVKDGWRDPQWWNYSDDAKAWRKKKSKPADPAFGGVADHPRANVTWYEAVAFCMWLSAKMDGTVTLTTEQQWQRAAVGDTGWAYPWGNEWDASRCNNRESGRNSTSPVMEYERKGDSPFGVVDMTGNVWEWCLTKFKVGEHDLNGADVRVLQGGSFNDFGANLRAALRYGGNPVIVNFNGGFRCAHSR